VSAVFKLNKAGVWFVLVPKENFCNLITVTYSTLGRTGFTAQADALVAARQEPGSKFTDILKDRINLKMLFLNLSPGLKMQTQ